MSPPIGEAPRESRIVTGTFVNAYIQSRNSSISSAHAMNHKKSPALWLGSFNYTLVQVTR